MFWEWEKDSACSSEQNIFIWIEMFDEKYVQYSQYSWLKRVKEN